MVGRRRLPSHTSTSSRHHDTTCATLHAAGSQASLRVLRRRPQLPVIVADSTSFFLSRSRQTPKSRRRLPSHTSTPSRHRDTTCATLALLPTELARPLRHLPLLAPPPLFRRPDYDGVLRRLATCAREAGWLLRHVLLRSVYLPFFPQNRSIVTAVLSTRHLARYSPKGLRQATGKHASGHGCGEPATACRRIDSEVSARSGARAAHIRHIARPRQDDMRGVLSELPVTQ